MIAQVIAVIAKRENPDFLLYKSAFFECRLLILGVGFHGNWMVADGALIYCEGSAVVLRMMCSTAANE